MINKKILRYLFFFIICFIFFFIGILFENKKYFPYIHLKSFYNALITPLHVGSDQKKSEIIKSKELYNQFEKIKLNYENYSTLETSVIRLDKKDYDFSNVFLKSRELKARGGICGSKNKLVIVSASGEGGTLDLSNNDFFFFDLSSYFNKKNIKIDIVQSILCFKQNSDKKISFLLNFQVEENEIFKRNNYIGNFSTNVYKIIIDKKEIKSKKIFQSQLHGSNWAGRMAAQKNLLYISFSSREANQEEKYEIPLSQDDRVLEGKIVEINLDNKTSSIYSKGHRNPQGLMIDSFGKIISTEHGPKGGDELNIILRNENYGWPIVTHGTTYESLKAYDYASVVPGRHTGFKKPIFSWTPGIGISNLLEIQNFDERWDNDLIISSLKNMSLYRIRLDEEKVLFSERIWIGSRIRDIELYQNKIFLWTDDLKVIVIRKSNETSLIRSNKSYDITRINICLSCHYLQTGEKPTKIIAPTLSRIFEKEIASDEFNYSEALKKLNGKWNDTKMVKYLLDPQKFAPGTSKSYNVKSQIEAFKIVEEIKKLSRSGD